MKKLSLLSIGLIVSCNSAQKSVSETTLSRTTTIASPVEYAMTITEEDLKGHLYIYASDDFEGRETGKPGQKKAVAYIQKQYEELGIPGAKKDGTYFQKVPLEMSKVPSGHISINGTRFDLGKDFVTFSSLISEYQEFAFLGFGIETETYSDFNGIDVQDKLILVEVGEPLNEDGTYKLTGTNEKSLWSNFNESVSKRMEIAAKKGARGILIHDSKNFSRLKARYDFIKRSDRSVMNLADENTDKMAAIFIGDEMANALLEAIDPNGTLHTVPMKILANIKNENQNIDSENVVAVLKGSEKPNEYVVISSHLDHIGINADGQINNGADDDGSGTVALFEIAEAFKTASAAGNGPKRSIVFLHVTGEEKGLLGSKYYTDHEPLFPLSNTVANLNIDMIGRIDPKREGNRNYIYLIGSDKLSIDLHNLSEEVNKEYTNIELDYTFNDENDPNRFYYRSDHYNFAKNNIPIIFYFNGTHADYHRPGDTPDKINYDLLENRTRLIFYTAWEVANRPKKVVVDKMAK
ncbi:MAG: M28 family metallopeptidase [Bacteroidota bacterium]